MANPGAISIPPHVIATTSANVAAHRVNWNLNAQWAGFLKHHPQVGINLANEVAGHGGIRRSYLKGLANGDPEEFFYSVMAWGFGTGHVHYPAQEAMLANPLPVARIEAIIAAVQTHGAVAGWNAMMRTSKIPGLGYGFGTKVLYFAGYGRVKTGPQPLILDSKVSGSLTKVAGFAWKSSYDKKAADYLAYLNLATHWAQDPTWQNGSEEAVEFALFS